MEIGRHLALVAHQEARANAVLVARRDVDNLYLENAVLGCLKQRLGIGRGERGGQKRAEPGDEADQYVFDAGTYDYKLLFIIAFCRVIRDPQRAFTAYC